MLNVRVLTTAMTVSLSVLVLTLTGVTTWLVLRQAQQSGATQQAVRDFTRANVRARYEDCGNINQILSALRQEVVASKRTNPVLFKLLPSLDTPEVHALVRQERRRELRTFAPRDCESYALAAIPAGRRDAYRPYLRTLDPSR